MTTGVLESNVGVIVTTALIGGVSLIWHLFQSKLASEKRSVDERIDNLSKMTSERISTVEREVSSLPARLEILASSLQRIELQLANNHPTKEEMRDVVTRNTGHLEGMETVMRDMKTWMATMQQRIDFRDYDDERRSRRTSTARRK